MKPFICLFLCFFGCIFNSYAQVAYSANGNSGFNGAIGGGSLSITDDGTTITVTLTRGSGSFNDTMVMYIDNGSAGRNIIDGNVNDLHDANRTSISNGNSGDITFPAGFEATHAIAINTVFGGLWSIPATGNIGNEDLSYINHPIGQPSSNMFPTFDFSFDWSVIGLTNTDDFSFVITYGNPDNNNSNTQMFSSDEAFGGGIPSGNPGLSPFSFTTYFEYPSGRTCGLASTSQSGNWSDTATWINEEIPGACNRVQINDDVILNQDTEVANLEISSGNALTSEASQSRVISILDGGSFTNNGTFNANDGKINFSGTGSVSGTVTFNDVDLSGSVDFGFNTTLTRELTLLSGGAVNGNPLIYGDGSILIYDSGGSLNRGSEWNNVGSPSNNRGTPHHVIVRSTDLDAGVNQTEDFFCNGNLTIENDGELSMSSPNEMEADLIIHGNLNNNGTLQTSQSITEDRSDIVVKGNYVNNGTANFTSTFGNDLYLEGDYTDNGTTNFNNRALFFKGNQAEQDLNASTDFYNIPFLVIEKTQGKVILNQNITLSGGLAGDVLDMRKDSPSEEQSALDLNAQTLQIGVGGDSKIRMDSLNATSYTKIIGDENANIIFNSSNNTGADNVLRFSQTGTENNIQDFEIYAGGRINISDTLKLKRRIVLADGTVNSDGNLTFLSDMARTAVISPAADDTFNGIITGGVVVHRYFQHTGLQRSFRYISPSVESITSIQANWQEGATSDNFNPNPGFGTHITGHQGTVGNVNISNGLDETSTGNPSLFTWNRNSQAWSPTINTVLNTLEIEDSFALMVRGDRSASLNSNLNESGNPAILRTKGELQGTSNFAYDFEVSSFNPGDTNKFIMVGNPYQAEVDMREVLSNASTGGVNPAYVWVWDPTLADKGAYAVIDLTTGNQVENNEDLNDIVSPKTSDANEFLQPFQAVFLQATDVNQDVIFERNDIKNDINNTNAQTTIFSSAANYNTSKLEINLYRTQDNLLIDAIRFNFGDNYNNTLSYEDAVKFWNYDENLAIIEDNAYISINKRQYPDQETLIPFYLSGYTQNDYSFEIFVDQWPDEQAVYLKDHYLNTFVTLDASQQIYNFTVDASIPESYDSQRFALLFQPQTLGLNSDETLNSFSLYPNPSSGLVYLNTSSEFQGTNASIDVFDFTGREVLTAEMTNLGLKTPIDLNMLASGFYLLKLETAGLTKTFKVQIK
jgi:hypothetical protein